MNERAVLFGPDENLVGLVTPATGTQSPVGVLMLNSGVVHRIGPHRFSVKLSRQLATLGHTCMRFDFSGVGDSRVPGNAADYRVQPVLDAKAAMDWMQSEYGIRSFALFGMCSGAVNAYSTALDDPRVNGVFMFDGYVYRTLKGRLVYLQSLGVRKAAVVVAKAVLRRLRRVLAITGVGTSSGITLSKDNPTPAEFAVGAQRLVDRGVKLAFLFSGHVLSHYSYAGQLRDTFRGHSFPEQVACHFEPDMDHSAALLESQRRLLAMATSWVESVVEASAVPASPTVTPYPPAASTGR